MGCNTCPNGVKPHLNEVLENLDGFKIHIQNGVPGALKVLDQLGVQTTDAIGANWVMKFTNANVPNPAAFEEVISSAGDFSADIVTQVNGVRKYYECKSWKGNLMDPSGSSKPSGFVKQMMNYFHTQTSLDNFGYYFDPGKWKPSIVDLNQVLRNNKDQFDINRWDNYQQLFGFSNIQVPRGNVEKLIDYITNARFNEIIKSL